MWICVSMTHMSSAKFWTGLKAPHKKNTETVMCRIKCGVFLYFINSPGSIDSLLGEKYAANCIYAYFRIIEEFLLFNCDSGEEVLKNSWNCKEKEKIRASLEINLAAPQGLPDPGSYLWQNQESILLYNFFPGGKAVFCICHAALNVAPTWYDWPLQSQNTRKPMLSRACSLTRLHFLNFCCLF